MSAIGAELPPHLLAKRKRKQEEENQDETSTDSGAKRSQSPGEGDKRRRVIGPAMPPASLDERPEAPPNRADQPESYEDDDDFGPALPSNQADHMQRENGNHNTKSTGHELGGPASQEKLQRDRWMTMPPKQDDLAARMDPTKIRARGFNTGKGAKGPGGHESDNSTWNETPEQKQKRLADEMMGVSKPTSSGSQRPPDDAATAKAATAAKKIREHTDKTRGPSLLDQHERRSDREPEDDPSKRAFDRDKDMGSGIRIGHSQRKEMLNKAGGFSSKFSGGSYL